MSPFLASQWSPGLTLSGKALCVPSPWPGVNFQNAIYFVRAYTSVPCSFVCTHKSTLFSTRRPCISTVLRLRRAPCGCQKHKNKKSENSSRCCVSTNTPAITKRLVFRLRSGKMLQQQGKNKAREKKKHC